MTKNIYKGNFFSYTLISISLAFIFLSIINTNFLLIITALSYLYFLYYFVFIYDRIKILSYFLFGTWLQISIKVFYATILNIEFSKLLISRTSANQAFYLSITGLYLLTLGIILMLYKIPQPSIEDTAKKLLKYNTFNLFKVYLIYSIIILILEFYIFNILSLRQIIVFFINLKWGLLFALVTLMFHKREFNKLIILFIIFEFFMGFTGFFSKFKTYLIIIILSYLSTYYHKFNIKNIIVFTALTLMLLFFGLLWGTIRGDYRNYISKSQNIQARLVSVSEAFAYLYFLISNTDMSTILASSNFIFQRISYIDYFSVVIDKIPNSQSYESGGITLKLLKHILLPRFIYRSKDILDDSADLNYYTGLGVAGMKKGASIGMGYFSYIYIDYGPIFMHLFLLLLGLVIGYLYKFIYLHSKNYLWKIIFVIPFVFSLGGFETSLYKVVGGLFAYFLLYLLFSKLLIKKLESYLRK